MVLLCVLLLTLSGCQLAKEEKETADQFIGIYLTTEYLDTMDVEAYLNDHLDDVSETLVVEQGEGQEYQEKLYAVDVSQDPSHPAYEFPGWEGIAVYCVPVPILDGEGVCWTPGEAPEVFQYHEYSASDEMDEIVITADLYVSAEDGPQEFYGNPMYLTPEGKVYLIGGTGISGDFRQAGTSVSKTIEQTTSITTNEETRQQRCVVKLNVTSVLPLEKTVLLQLDADSQVIQRSEFLPGQVPPSITPAGETAYLVVESHRVSRSGQQTVERELFDRQDSSFSTYEEGENGFFCRADTSLAWTEVVR